MSDNLHQALLYAIERDSEIHPQPNDYTLKIAEILLKREKPNENRNVAEPEAVCTKCGSCRCGKP